jgi:Predicted transmembrane transcriptional regulator (anti-sigma factor)
MNCDDVIPLLSPLHDGELAPEQLRAVAEHVASCPGCSQELDSIRRLSDLVESTPTPEAPSTLVTRIESSLQERALFWPSLTRRISSRNAVAALVAMAAVIAVGITVWRFTANPSHGHAEMVHAFGEFLAAYEEGQTDKLDLLVRKYQGTPVSPEAAASALKRATVSKQSILDGHEATQRYVLKMPCCDCVQTIYARNGQTSIVLFEHDQAENKWFAARPMIHAACRGKACCLVQLKQGIAATWPVEGGFVTVVGVRDVSELSNLVDELHALE